MSTADREAAFLLNVKLHMTCIVVELSRVNNEDALNTALRLQKLRARVFSPPVNFCFFVTGEISGEVSCG